MWWDIYSNKFTSIEKARICFGLTLQTAIPRKAIRLLKILIGGRVIEILRWKLSGKKFDTILEYSSAE